MRLALLDERFDTVAAVIDAARARHQGWLAEVFAGRLPRVPAERRRALAALHAATDVATWKLLRRDLGLGRRVAQRVMTDTVAAIVASWPPTAEEER